jgi:transglutaminase-like putative cysteine protease
MREQDIIRRLLSSGLLIVLVAQWLSPLSQLSGWTDVYAIEPILITIIGILMVDVLRIATVWTWIVKLLIIVSSVASIFHGTSILQLGWWMEFAIFVIQDLLCILTGQWSAVSAEGRTLLFIGSWAAVVCWVYGVIFYQRMALFVSMLTTVYLLTLHIWFEIDTTKGIVLSIIAGISLHGLSVLPALEYKFGVTHRSPGWPISWVISSLVLVTVTVGFGFVASIGQEREAFRLPAMKSMNWEALETLSPLSWQRRSRSSTDQGEPEQKSGYSMVDSSLGGAVTSDDSIAFVANTELPKAYWRGESKAMYDGKGWSNLTNDVFGYEIGAQLPDVLSDGSKPSTIAQQRPSFFQEIFPFPNYPHNAQATLLLSNGAIHSVEGVGVKEGAISTVGPVILDRIEGKYLLQNSASSTLTSYRLNSSNPLDAEAARLVAASEKPISLGISGVYTQLPETLPERVNQLAHLVTDKYYSTWEKANAIEQFLSEHYSYTLNPKPPAKEGDFVDQFLFEQQEGYCDYFSTAMTILLRSVGIPARWVKGFAPGEIIPIDKFSFLQESAIKLQASQVITYPVIVRNRNAHSWVEVYISGIGWTAFDPTPQGAVAATQHSSVVAPTTLVEEEGADLLSTLLFGTLSFIAHKRTLFALLWIIILIVSGQCIRILFRAKSIRHGLHSFLIQMLMFSYASGVATKHADIRLLKRVLTQAFARYEHGLRRGETLQESVARGYFPDQVVVPLIELISLYESACYGPNLRKRIPYHSIAQSWRLLR